MTTISFLFGTVAEKNPSDLINGSQIARNSCMLGRHEIFFSIPKSVRCIKEFHSQVFGSEDRLMQNCARDFNENIIDVIFSVHEF